ncbi:LacI family DNA-binding transcriptional regulator [uncultured Nocardioides sp.]|uniref:LacI family DNA-binding transcriptional regulator n=1 Tax=uncultured Nocardioides sp. TaxID=198441 RepID=UPI0026079402|nr:LacI family DNA-binding transcriptional regulator [uncultured Nocardioides sp.]
MSRTRPATMADVARLAGVSTATVSRVLSGTRAVDPAMAERVTSAAGRLDYRINLLGRGLRRTSTATVGLVLPDLRNPFFSALGQHLARAFAGSEVDLLLFSADDSLATEARGVRSFLGRQVDALVLIPVHEERSAEAVALAASSVRTVQLDRRVPGTQASYVGVSNRDGIALVHDHLVAAADLVSHPVTYVGATPDSSSAHERLDAVRRWFGQEVDCLLGDFSAAWGREAAARLLSSGARTGTLICAADVIAAGAVAHLLAAGHRVPEDFRVTGFDGVGAEELTHPSLTTVRQPVEAMAAAIRDLVVSEGDASARWFEPTLVVGGTSPG